MFIIIFEVTITRELLVFTNKSKFSNYARSVLCTNRYLDGVLITQNWRFSVQVEEKVTPTHYN